MVIAAREYQEAGINWLISKKKAMLTDAVGLGKTYQSAEAIERAGAFPALVVCPSHLVNQWAEFLKAQYPTRKVSYSRKADFFVRDWAMQEPADWYIANTEMLRDIDFYTWPNVKAVIFDESHNLKNRESKQSIGALKLIFKRQPEYVFLLTATPIKREADDLFAQLRIIRPDIFTSYNTFVKTFCIADQTPWDLRVLGIKNKSDLMNLLERVMLRREYEEVGMELPELITSVITIEFSPKQREAYDRLKNELILKIGVDDEEEIPYMWYIQALQTLRQMTATDDKINAAVDLAEDSGGAVIFCHYKNTAAKIADKLGVQVINGEIPALQRAEIAKKQKHVVATIDSLSTGINGLERFDTVIFAEEDYTYGTNHQALGRVRRFGADVNRPIIKYCLHVENSIDEIVHAVSERRTATAQDILKSVLELAPAQTGVMV